ncbi:carbon-nitrogen hydrolase family protein [bacterium]|nr:carbon-nitrogen hydrolase family protein [bacterium]
MVRSNLYAENTVNHLRVASAQILSVPGHFKENFSKHLALIKLAVANGVDVILFPELSLTAYEPKMIKDLVPLVEQFDLSEVQDISNRHNLTILLGLPTKGTTNPRISLRIFQANLEPIDYSKQLLHEDELAYFEPGSQQEFLEVKAVKIVPGICYETMQEKHNEIALAEKADLYLASVAKDQQGILKAVEHYQKLYHNTGVITLVSNCIGPMDGVICAGMSTVIHRHDSLVLLNEKEEGLLIYDYHLGQVRKVLLPLEI